MTTQPAPRRFSPIFVATVTPSDISTREGKNGAYIVMPEATIEREGREPKNMTVMAFGKPRDEVASALNQGQPVDLAVQYDGGTLKVIGFPRAKAA